MLVQLTLFCKGLVFLDSSENELHSCSILTKRYFKWRIFLIDYFEGNINKI